MNEKGINYPGYPITRLTAADVSIEATGTIILPDGPWVKNNTHLPTEAETDAFRTAGYETDSEGRPLHPWLKQMLTTPEVGVITGKGFYHNWGPNFTADPIVLTREVIPSVLLIQRVDTGVWALPGGFVDPGEKNPLDTAARELYEETNLDINQAGVSGELIYQDVVADLRTTAHSWAETSAYSFIVESPLPVLVRDPKEVRAVQWFPMTELPENLHGSHAVLIELALEKMRNSSDHDRKSIRDILNTPNSQLETTIVDAGHMAYDHLFVRDGIDQLFVKVHDASRFTDPFREAHSRAYLQKEYAIYRQLATKDYPSIPNRVDLIDDTLLAMDALHEDDGWQWQAPKDSRFDQYVRDVLNAFQRLQASPIPIDPSYHKAIEPTYETFWKEGWDDLTDEKMNILVTRIQQLSSDWSDTQQEYAQQLVEDLPALRHQAAVIDRTVPLFMAHNDARQSNIAWRPESGAKLVDWSWGDPAPKDADSTMFLIDLMKSGFDVTPYLEYINRDQLIVQIGFLIAHSLWNTRDGSTTVREQQIASATAARRLL